MGRTAFRALGALLACVLSIAVCAPRSLAAEATQYTYDALGRVVSAIDQSGKKVAYTYDSAGNRTRVSNGAEFTEIIPTAWSASSNAGTTGLTATNGMRDGGYSTTGSIHATNVETNAWIKADLGSVQNVNHIEVTAAIESTTGATLADINDTAVEYSVDGTIWNVAATIEGISPAAPRSISLGGVSLRYLRIRRTNSGRVALGDLRLYSAAAANTPLIANPDSITSTGSAVTFDPRTNDQDLDGYAIAISGVDTPPHGTAVVNAGVSITYTPNAGYVGADSFLYTVTDGHNGAASARVAVMVQSSTNHAPVAVNDQFNISDRATAVVDGINSLRPLNNDYDADGDILTITGTSTPAHGSVSVVGSGIVQYQPVIGYTGTDSFTYTISDGRGGTSTATITVVSSNTNPVAVQDNITTSRGAPVTFDPRLNDSDPNGDPISVTSITAAANGTATLNGDQTITYVPNTGFAGGDSLTYALSDGRGGMATGLVSITVTPSTPPLAMPDSISASAATPVTFDPRSNDVSPESRPLTIVAVTAPAHGTTSIGGAGASITYTSTTGYSGGDTFSYTISDDRGAMATAIVSVNGLSVDYLAVGGGGGGGPANGGGGGGGGVIKGTTAIAVGSISVTVGSGGAGGTSAPGATGGSSSVGSSLVAQGGGGGGYAGSPNGGQVGGSGGGAPGVVNGTGGSGTSGQGFKGGDSVASGRDAGGGGGGGGPGLSGSNSTGSGGGGPGLVSAISGASIDYAGGGGGGAFTNETTFSAPAGAAGGSSGAPGGSWGSGALSPPANRGGGGGGGGYNSNSGALGAPSAGGSGVVILRYIGAPKATGGTITQVGGYTIHTFTAGGTFAVTSANAGPTAANDAITVPSGLPFAFDPRTNDSDPNGDALTVTALGTPSHGTVAFSAFGLPVKYTPTLGYTGSNSFTYTIGDGQGLTSTATVTVTVTGGVSVDVLVVGGGGGGGSLFGGGGGGGEVKSQTFLIASGAHTITIGSRGAAGVSFSQGANGGASSIDSWIVAHGGGGGGGYAGAPVSTGANGGGGPGGGATSPAAGGSAYGGFSGGVAAAGWVGGGGGGATANGHAGALSSDSIHSSGGAGATSSISGTATPYGAGGGGGAFGNDATGAGYPAGIWGNSSAGSGGYPGNDAAPNQGGGGGGGGQHTDSGGTTTYFDGGNGGSGVVVIRYLTGAMTATGGTITTSGGYTIHTFRGNGTFTVP